MTLDPSNKADAQATVCPQATVVLTNYIMPDIASFSPTPDIALCSKNYIIILCPRMPKYIIACARYFMCPRKYIIAYAQY